MGRLKKNKLTFTKDTKLIVGDFNVGKVIIYSWDSVTNNWHETDELFGNKFESGHNFGVSCSINRDGNRLAVGVDNKDVYRGAVFIYGLDRLGDLDEVYRIQRGDGKIYDQFGSSCSLSSDGTKLIIGANGRGGYRGIVYTYVLTEHNGAWNEICRTVCSNNKPNARFGSSCSLSGDGTKMIVGAGGKNTNSIYTYIWNNDTESWDEVHRLLNDDYGTHNQFGLRTTLSKDGSKLVVETLTSNKRVIYTYLWDESSRSWFVVNKLHLADEKSGNCVATSCTLSNDSNQLVVVSTMDSGYHNSGQIRTYLWNLHNNTWDEYSIQDDIEIGRNEYFGYSCALS